MSAPSHCRADALSALPADAPSAAAPPVRADAFSTLPAEASQTPVSPHAAVVEADMSTPSHCRADALSALPAESPSAAASPVRAAALPAEAPSAGQSAPSTGANLPPSTRSCSCLLRLSMSSWQALPATQMHPSVTSAEMATNARSRRPKPARDKRIKGITHVATEPDRDKDIEPDPFERVSARGKLRPETGPKTNKIISCIADFLSLKKLRAARFPNITIFRTPRPKLCAGAPV